MYNSIRKDIDHLDDERDYLEADWQISEHRLLEFYVKVMPAVLDAERCSIFIAERGTGNVWLRAGTGVREREIEVGKLAESIVGEAVRTGETIYRDKLDEREGASAVVDSGTGFVTRDILCMPIRSLDGSQITGAVQLLNRAGGRPYSDEDKALVAEMLHYLELSIESIFFQQDASGAIGRVYRLLRRVTAGAAIAFFVIIGLFSIYWFGFFLAGQ